MFERKYMVLSFLVFCLTATLFVSVTSSAEYNPWADITGDGLVNIWDLSALSDAWLTEGIPIARSGNISVPAAAFTPRWSTDSARNEGWELYNYESSIQYFFAPVQLPHGATITKVTFYWWDAGTSDISCYLQNFRQGYHDTMALLFSTGSAGRGSSSVTNIIHPNVDNNQYAYSMRLVIPYSASHVDYYFEHAFIEYTYL